MGRGYYSNDMFLCIFVMAQGREWKRGIKPKSRETKGARVPSIFMGVARRQLGGFIKIIVQTRKIPKRILNQHSQLSQSNQLSQPSQPASQVATCNPKKA